MTDIVARPDRQSVRELERALTALDKKTKKQTNIRALKSASRPILRAAKANAPVDTGGLKKNIKLIVNPYLRRAKYYFGVRVTVKADSFHGVFQEEGTANITPNKFLLPAYKSNRDNVAATFIDTVWREIVLVTSPF